MTDEPLPPPTGEPFYAITPEEGGASDIEAMWLAEDFRDEADGYDPSDDEGDLLAEIDRLRERFGMTYEEARYRLGFDIRRGETST